MTPLQKLARRRAIGALLRKQARSADAEAAIAGGKGLIRGTWGAAKGGSKALADFMFHPDKGGRGAVGELGHFAARHVPEAAVGYGVYRAAKPFSDPYLAQKAENYRMRYMNQQMAQQYPQGMYG